MTVRLICGAELLHIPKTGGSWVTSVLEANGLVSGLRGHSHADYDRNLLRSAMTERHHLREAGRLLRNRLVKRLRTKQASDSVQPFRFCFVRHPLSWYESWWKYMKGRSWHDWGTQNSSTDWHPNAILNGLGSDSFNEFVWNVVKVRPGYVSELFFSYTKPGIGFIGKTENLREDLRYVLDRLGHPYDKNTIFDSKASNVSKIDASEIQWDHDLKQVVMRLELPALVHFGYLTEHQREEFGVPENLLPHQSIHRKEER